MSGHYEAPIREPLILGHKTYHDITEDIARPVENRAGAFGVKSFVLQKNHFFCCAAGGGVLQ